MKFTSKRSEAIKIIYELSQLLADYPEYEDDLQPKLQKLINYIKQ